MSASGINVCGPILCRANVKRVLNKKTENIIASRSQTIMPGPRRDGGYNFFTFFPSVHLGINSG